MKFAKRFHITGKVQGVLFRASTKEIADELGITGWVRNNDDGTVEVHAEGTEAQLEVLEAWLRQGPSLADVTNISSANAAVDDAKTFQIN